MARNSASSIVVALCCGVAALLYATSLHAQGLPFAKEYGNYSPQQFARILRECQQVARGCRLHLSAQAYVDGLKRRMNVQFESVEAFASAVEQADVLTCEAVVARYGQLDLYYVVKLPVWSDRIVSVDAVKRACVPDERFIRMRVGTKVLLVSDWCLNPQAHSIAVTAIPYLHCEKRHIRDAPTGVGVFSNCQPF